MDAPSLIGAPRFVHTYSRYSVGPELAVDGGGVLASAVWPTANKAFYFPFGLPFRFNVRRMFVANGGTVSGNFDIGIYTLDGKRIYASGSTAQAGTTALQYVSLSTELILPPDAYYLALAFDNTTATTQRNAAAGINGVRAMGVLQETSAFALPASMTPAAVSAVYVPLFGITSTSSGF